MRTHSGKLVVIGILALAIGGTYLLNLVTAGPPRILEQLASQGVSPPATPPATRQGTPSSGPAEPGRSVPIRIESPCGGLVPAVDFDGSFWRPHNGRSMAVIGRRLKPPVDPSTITLQSGDSALLHTASGDVVILTRGALDRMAFPVCDRSAG